jgi:hypothetical protein
MNCPGCGTAMTAMTLEGRMGGQVAIDVCARCQAFWLIISKVSSSLPAPH